MYSSPTLATYAAVVVLYVFCEWLVVILHESGHLLAGLTMGYRFRQLRVGPLLLYVRIPGRGLRAGWAQRARGGHCAMIPNGRRSTWHEACWLLAAGSFVTCLLGGVSVACLVGGVWNARQPSLVGVALYEFAVASMISLYVNAVPYMSANATRDFAWLWWLLRNPNTREQAMAVRHVSEMLAQGTRPRDLPEDLLARVLEVPAPPVLVVLASMQLYYRQIDLRQAPEAIATLDELARRIRRKRARLIASFQVEVAFFIARYRYEGRRANAILAKVRSRQVERSRLLRARAAAALAMGEWAQAESYVVEARRQLVSHVEQGLSFAEDAWLQQILGGVALGRGEQPSVIPVRVQASGTLLEVPQALPGRDLSEEDLASVGNTCQVLGLTLRLRIAIRLAQDEAVRFHHDFVGTEHLLLGLARLDGSLAARVLQSSGVTLPQLHGEVASGMDADDEQVPEATEFTDQAKVAFTTAVREARNLGHEHVGSEHLLLGLLGNEDGNAAVALVKRGLTLRALRTTIERLMESVLPVAPATTASGSDV